MTRPPAFRPEPPLLPGLAHSCCRASIVVPARNEQASLAATLDALAAQVDAYDRPLDRDSFEVLLLLNNCSDGSAEVAAAWQRQHPSFALHRLECQLPPERAHVGWARRLLMDTAWHRLQHAGRAAAILSTDADTLVDPHWIVNNLAALDQGADAVGGLIHLQPAEFASLSPGVQQAFRRDRDYQFFIAELEDLLDPQPGDPWPRHLEHFGASLACTPQAYARAGGLPPVAALEDVAFVDALRRSSARLRHDPQVQVFTSARLSGRASVGLAFQLRRWQQMTDQQTPQLVPSAAALVHRFTTLRSLRQFYARTLPPPPLPPAWIQLTTRTRDTSSSVAEFLGAIDCDRLVHESAPADREGEIQHVIRTLSTLLARLRSAQHSVSGSPGPASSPAAQPPAPNPLQEQLP